MYADFTQRRSLGSDRQDVWVCEALCHETSLGLCACGASSHVNIHLIAMMRVMGTPVLRTILKTALEIH